MGVNRDVLRDVGPYSPGCTLPLMKPWKLFTAFQATCRVSNREGY